MGLANCPDCGVQVGTLFSEQDAAPQVSRARYRKHIANQVDYYQEIETARERAYMGMVLALASFFFPILGAVMAIVSLFWSVGALRTLNANHMEEGRGMAGAGVIIGGLAMVAQFCYLVYFAKMGVPFLG